MIFFVREGMRVLLVGVVTRLVVTAGVSGLLAGFLFGWAPVGLQSFIAGAVVLCVVAVIANYVPARRATSADPLVALGND